MKHLNPGRTHPATRNPPDAPTERDAPSAADEGGAEGEASARNPRDSRIHPGKPSRTRARKTRNSPLRARKIVKLPMPTRGASVPGAGTGTARGGSGGKGPNHKSSSPIFPIRTACPFSWTPTPISSTRRSTRTRQGVVERAIEEGVHYIISMGTCLESSRQTLDLTVSYAGVYAAVGVHPSDVEGVDERTIKEIAGLAGNPKVVAIGEIGLDYYRDNAPRKTQRRWFREQIRVAVEAGKPIVVHCRDAADDVYEILEEEKAWRAGGVIHCFTGDDEQARKFLGIDFHLGAGGAIAFSRSEELREVFERIPIERVLLETDSPYLAPPPHRGKRNEPAYVARVAEILAELHGMPVAEVTRLTTENVRRLFGVGPQRVEGSVAYSIGEALYLNITNDCQNSCFFCGLLSDCVYKGQNLALAREPDAGEVLAAVGDPSRLRGSRLQRIRRADA